MFTKRIRILSAMMAAVLVFSPVLSARAAELPEETVAQTQPAETTPQTVTEPGETIPPTEPPETTVPTVSETQPPETTAPTVPETEPAETAAPTVPETEPVETTVPTVPATESTEPVENTEPAESTTAPTELPSETEPESQETIFATIAEAWAMPPGTQNITLRGTVVFAMGNQAVLQDSTGGIRLSFADTPNAQLGDELEVTGMRSGGFFVTDFAFLGTSTLPAVETTLLDAQENVRVHIRNATLGDNLLSQNGFSMTMIASLPESAAGTKVDAYGVILDGRFYADSILPRASTEVTLPEAEPGWNLYFGQLHAHTDLSDGLGSVAEAFRYASMVEGLDFFAVTDHSNSFDNAALGAIDSDGTGISTEWAEGKAAAAAVTDENFVGIFGYEMTWTEDKALGHMNTFNTPGWQTREQPGFETLQGYYEALTTVPGSISQFNHPSHAYGNFQYFSHYCPAYDEVIQLLEVGSEGNVKAYDLYTRALDEGWHVAPTNNQNNHNGSWGDASGARTVVLAEALTEESLFSAIRSHRVYATEDCDLEVIYRLNDKIMGSVLGPTRVLTASVSLKDPTDTMTGALVEVIVDGGETAASRRVEEIAGNLYIEVPAGYSYYYLRITQPDGDMAVTAPVWVDGFENMGIGSFESDVPDPSEGQEVTLTLEMFNEEAVDFLLEKVEFTMDGSSVGEISEPGTVGAMGKRTYSIPFFCAQPGELRILATVTGTVENQPRTYEKTLILRCQTTETILTSTVAQVRAGTPGTSYRIKGYVTVGNENPYNTFPDTLYLQDDTGGIAVTGSLDVEIKVGDPMAITGVLLEQNGNLVLELTGYELTGETTYRYVPETMANALAMDYSSYGGTLVQIQGEVASLTKTADGKGVSRFTIKDVRGTLATVVIENTIRSGAHGTNELASKVKKGRTVRAMGLLHVDEYGQTVLRVRNCDEVVYVPPKADPSNPKTGDWFFFWK